MSIRIFRRLRELLDVNASAPSDGDALVWDQTTSKWVNAPVSGAGATAAADVSIVDAGGYYGSTDVEGALQEAGAAVGSIPTVEAATHAASSKVTPVDNDEIPLADSAASYALKKLTWANLKATAKAYFDTLYAAVSHTHAASDIASGTIAQARLGSGSSGAGALFLADDQTYKAPSATVSVTRDARSSNTILGTADRGKVIAATAGYTQTFTAAATLGSGWWCYIKNESATGLLTLDPNSTETIDGAATKVLLPGQMILVECDGSNFTSQVLADPYEWTTVYKTSDESVASSTSVQDDDELFFTAASGALYAIEIEFVYGSPAGGGTPDFKFDLGEDTNVRGGVLPVGTIGAADSITTSSVLTNQTATGTLGTATENRLGRYLGTHVGGGGTFKVRWAQGSSGLNATVLRAGSLIRYRRIA